MAKESQNHYLVFINQFTHFSSNWENKKKKITAVNARKIEENIKK